MATPEELALWRRLEDLRRRQLVLERFAQNPAVIRTPARISLVRAGILEWSGRMAPAYRLPPPSL